MLQGVCAAPAEVCHTFSPETGTDLKVEGNGSVLVHLVCMSQRSQVVSWTVVTSRGVLLFKGIKRTGSRLYYNFTFHLTTCKQKTNSLKKAFQFHHRNF